jgi:hypothetical protein
MASVAQLVERKNVPLPFQFPLQSFGVVIGFGYFRSTSSEPLSSHQIVVPSQ